MTDLADRPGLATPLAEHLAPYSANEAVMEAERCLYCFDAPCMHACPTHIDIPAFIRKIASGNVRGSGMTILDSNLLGATCARVCPVEELCEGACVLNHADKPITIGRLQRYATDHLARVAPDPYAAGPATGRRVLVVGSGPAGLSAAGELAKCGHAVTIWERSELAGGLSTYGIIPLREPIEVALGEVAMIERLGVEVMTETALAEPAALDAALGDFDAVFLATGLGAVPRMDVAGDEHTRDGLVYIAQAKLNQPDPADAAAKHVVVIGAGNTAIDAATVAVRRGAKTTIVYRRTAAEMPAYQHEYEFALREGIDFSFLTQPVEVLTDGERVVGIRCVAMQLGEPDASGRRRPEPIEGSESVIACDLVVRAIGQDGYTGDSDFGLALERGYLGVDAELRTSRDRVWAGGDAIRARGAASTVMAVQDGKKAAAAIDRFLQSGSDTGSESGSATRGADHG